MWHSSERSYVGHQSCDPIIGRLRSTTALLGDPWRHGSRVVSFLVSRRLVSRLVSRAERHRRALSRGPVTRQRAWALLGAATVAEPLPGRTPSRDQLVRPHAFTSPHNKGRQAEKHHRRYVSHSRCQCVIVKPSERQGSCESIDVTACGQSQRMQLRYGTPMWPRGWRRGSRQ